MPLAALPDTDGILAPHRQLPYRVEVQEVSWTRSLSDSCWLELPESHESAVVCNANRLRLRAATEASPRCRGGAARGPWGVAEALALRPMTPTPEAGPGSMSIGAEVGHAAWCPQGNVPACFLRLNRVADQMAKTNDKLLTTPRNSSIIPLAWRELILRFKSTG